MRHTPRIARSGSRRPAVAASAATVAAALLASGFAGAPAQAAGQEDPAKALHLSGKERLVPRGTVTDEDGTVHTRYERTYEGLPVLGGDLVVHQDKQGKVEDVTKAVEAAIKVPTTKAKISAPAARRQAMLASADEGAGAFISNQAPRKVVWAAKGAPVLAYETVVGGLQHDGTPSELHVVTDATTGKKLDEFQAIATGTGTGMYNGKVPVNSVKSGGRFYMKDGQRGGHTTFHAQNKKSGESFPAFSNTRDVWGNGKQSMAQTAAVDAQYGAAMTWDYYKNVLGRKGIKGNGKAANSFVHYGNGYNNAFWSDECFCMVYGDGKGNKAPLTSLDVAGHEMTHGVTSATARLRYEGESGGLNEATSDIFGTAVEFYARNGQDKGDYLIGEKLGKPLRYMDKPSKDGRSADYWRKDLGDLDVHYSSGVANHFFYLLAEGSGAKTINGVKYNSPTWGGIKVNGIGRGAAEKLWYKALTVYMTTNTDYKGARSATLKAARDMFGTKSKQYKTVQAAWDGVNVK
ncbi:M4 family metallopeptidase [Streptomyces mobaraensis]|uniref:Neutral metalloproteinase n=1 Tax=Streptomyces mobaraensis TaxID=35621 RepID=A0A5N5WEA8_STRMB|nr:M4 family metallopeptidase [Streptomyces mobaraensis]KAB7851257.1 M4 family metallopeptidase [Streptomyces mobaraensis]